MSWSVLIAALILVESGGDPRAVGDGGNAVGCLQIWPCVIEDVNRVYGTGFEPDDRLNPSSSRNICRLYLSHYGRAYERRTGRPATPEVLARIWNGGPRGYAKQSTLNYWRKVGAAL
jgi:soluble lytic murein transglycosylase-like protein